PRSSPITRASAAGFHGRRTFNGPESGGGSGGLSLSRGGSLSVGRSVCLAWSDPLLESSRFPGSPPDPGSRLQTRSASRATARPTPTPTRHRLLFPFEVGASG